jgi:hypothetical protein
MSLHVAAQVQVKQHLPFTKGVYGDPGILVKGNPSFTSLGINALFVRSTSLTPALYHAAREEGIRIYAEFPVLNGQEYLTRHPEAWPINEKGEPAPPAEWFTGICPTDSGFREYRREQLKTLLQEFRVDGVWLDYLHWHAQFETPDPVLPETCFCNRCIKQFGEDMAIEIPSGNKVMRAAWILEKSDSSWRQWRSMIINSWVRDLKGILKGSNQDGLLGIYYCSWYPEEFEGALYRNLGLDLLALAQIADVFSPMLYHGMMEKPPAWVGEYVKWLVGSGITNGEKPLIWPIVQAHNKPGVITTEEFRQIMWSGSRSPASGIMMFTIQDLLGHPGKLEVMKDLYKKR